MRLSRQIYQRAFGAGRLVAARGFDAAVLWAVATVGNTLGADRAGRWFARYGSRSLLFAWVPVVGDPLTVAAGLLRVMADRAFG